MFLCSVIRTRQCGDGIMSDNEDNFDGDDFEDVEEDEGLDDLENAGSGKCQDSPIW